MNAAAKIVVVALAAASAVAVTAQSGNLMKPKSSKDIHDAVVLPEATICWNTDDAFGVSLGLSPSASQVKVVRTNVEWATATTVTEFEPSKPMPPYTRFIFHETPQSHKVSWAMGVAFFASEALAKEAGAKIAQWYAQALHRELRSSIGAMYSVSAGDLSLLVLVDEKAVRVSCEHGPTQNIAVQEGLALPRGK